MIDMPETVTMPRFEVDVPLVTGSPSPPAPPEPPAPAVVVTVPWPLETPVAVPPIEPFPAFPPPETFPPVPAVRDRPFPTLPTLLLCTPIEVLPPAKVFV